MANGIRDVSREISDLLQGESNAVGDLSLDLDPVRERLTVDLLETLDSPIQTPAAEDEALALSAPAASQETAKILADLSRGAPSGAPFASVAESIAANRAQQIADILELRSRQRAEDRQERALRTNTAAALAGLLGSVERVQTERERKPIEMFTLLANARQAGVQADNALRVIESQINQRLSATENNLVNLELTREKIKQERFQNDFNARHGEYVQLLKLGAEESDALKKQAQADKAVLERDYERTYGAQERINDALADQISLESAAIKLNLDKNLSEERERARIEGLRRGNSGDQFLDAIGRSRGVPLRDSRGQIVSPSPTTDRAERVPPGEDLAGQALRDLQERREEIILDLKPEQPPRQLSEEEQGQRGSLADEIVSGAQDDQQKVHALILKAVPEIERRTGATALDDQEWQDFTNKLRSGPLSAADARFLNSMVRTAAIESDLVGSDATLKEIMEQLGILNATQ